MKFFLQKFKQNYFVKTKKMILQRKFFLRKFKDVCENGIGNDDGDVL